jgi:hypothetical protein
MRQNQPLSEQLTPFTKRLRNVKFFDCVWILQRAF